MSALAALARDAVARRRGDPEAAADLLLDAGTDLDEVKGYLTAKAATGATAHDVAALVRAVGVRTTMPSVAGACDLVGTGGDGAGTINVSTLSALVAVAAGAVVAKAGNRAATSRCGSADLLAELDVPIDAGPAGVAESLRRHGFAFILSSAIHPALVRLRPLRRSLGLPTLFNLSGPLTNPVVTGARVVGVAGERECDVVAEAACALGFAGSWIVRAADGMDELSTRVATTVLVVGRTGVTTTTVEPAELGLRPARPVELAGSDPRTNALVARSLLCHGAPPGLATTCVLNAAALLAAVDGCPEPQDGIRRRLAATRHALEGGEAARLLADLMTPRRQESDAHVPG